jgi:hypothetical protein
MISQLEKICFFSFFFILDISFTYIFFRKYCKLFPKDKNWAIMESNLLMKFCWGKYGLNKGTLIGSIILYPILCLIILLITYDFLLGMIFGMYILVIFIHLINFKTFEELKCKLKKKKSKR